LQYEHMFDFTVVPEDSPSHNSPLNGFV
jgi:hypothetical protein